MAQRKYIWWPLTALLFVGATAAGVGFAASQRAVDHAIEDAEAFLSNEGSDAQRSALADQVVSADEYRAAIKATLSCFDSAGLEYEVEVDWSGLAYQYVVSSSLEPSDVEASLEVCYNTHAVAVDSVYQMSIDDQRGDLLLDIGECLANEVGDDPDAPHASDLDEIEVIQMTRALHPQVWDLCVSMVVPPTRLPQL